MSENQIYAWDVIRWGQSVQTIPLDRLQSLQSLQSQSVDSLSSTDARVLPKARSHARGSGLQALDQALRVTQVEDIYRRHVVEAPWVNESAPAKVRSLFHTNGRTAACCLALQVRVVDLRRQRRSWRWGQR